MTSILAVMVGLVIVFAWIARADLRRSDDRDADTLAKRRRDALKIVNDAYERDRSL